MDQLNAEQREAVTTVNGPLLILAGAGSGKTRVITYRITHLIEQASVPPWQILAVTFTNKAAGEMKARVEAMLPPGRLNSAPLISTFHSLCVRVLRRDIERLQAGYTRNFTIYDTDDQARVVRGIMKDYGIDDKTVTARSALSAISWAKNRSISPAAYANQAEFANDRTEKIALAYKQYETRLQQSNALDFDDLLIKAVALLRQVEEVRAYYHERYRHVMIDEFQDTNGIQYELARLIAVGSPSVERANADNQSFWQNRSLCVVGDLDQCVPEGACVLTPGGYKPIEKIRKGERIIAAGGHGRVLPARVDEVKTKPYRGRVVEIVTKSGKRLRVTPNHILFGKINPLVDKHIVYLMYRQDKGYRIGRSLGARKQRREEEDVFGLRVWLHQEHADKMWVLRVCDSKADAAYYEAFYAAHYGIPTLVFHLNGRGEMVWTQGHIDRLYAGIDTRERIRQLFEDFCLFEGYPHLKAKARFDVGRYAVNLVMFGDSRTSMNAPWGGHRIQFATTDQTLQPQFESVGLATRPGKRRTWRHETARIDFRAAQTITQTMQQLDSRIDVIHKAALVEDERPFLQFPASHFYPGMDIAVYDDEKVFEDTVVATSFSDFQGKVYDLNIADVHNFICEDVVCHNSIYAFRGSDYNIILNFQHDFAGTRIIKLEENYRSTQTILEAANKVIAKNTQRIPKNLFTRTGQGEKIRYYQSYDGEGEASFVGEKIQEHLRRDPKTRCAVLYRTNSQSRLFEETLRRRGITYNIVGGFSFYERAEVKDTIAYLKLALNQNDDVAIGRVINTPPRGIGKTTLDTLARQQKDLGVSLWETIGVAIENRALGPRATAALESFRQIITALGEKVERNEPLSEIVKAATLDTGYVKWLQDDKTEESETRLFNIEELVTAAVEAEEHNETLRDFIDHAALVSDTDQYKEDARVTLMTIHAAKGLEFPVVFMVGLEEGLFPHSRTFQSEEELEEERRLCYVAITRAQHYLYITHAMKRRTWGEELPAEPSRFLNEIPLELLQDMSFGPSWLGFAARPETQHNRQAASALRGDQPSVKKTTTYTGKTYNSADSVRDFFKRQVDDAGARSRGPGAGQKDSAISDQSKGTKAGPRSLTPDSHFRVGAKVKHAKYGTGVVLRSEGAGEDAKLTVSFPGYGLKKFVAKFAALEKL